jgi:hypothetical protein
LPQPTSGFRIPELEPLPGIRRWFRIAVAGENAALVWAERSVIEASPWRQKAFDPFKRPPDLACPVGVETDARIPTDQGLGQLHARIERIFFDRLQGEGLVAAAEVPDANFVPGAHEQRSAIGPANRRRKGTTMREQGRRNFRRVNGPYSRVALPGRQHELLAVRVPLEALKVNFLVVEGADLPARFRVPEGQAPNRPKPSPEGDEAIVGAELNDRTSIVVGMSKAQSCPLLPGLRIPDLAGFVLADRQGSGSIRAEHSRLHRTAMIAGLRHGFPGRGIVDGSPPISNQQQSLPVGAEGMVVVIPFRTAQPLPNRFLRLPIHKPQGPPVLKQHAAAVAADFRGRSKVQSGLRRSLNAKGDQELQGRLGKHHERLPQQPFPIQEGRPDELAGANIPRPHGRTRRHQDASAVRCELRCRHVGRMPQPGDGFPAPHVPHLHHLPADRKHLFRVRAPRPLWRPSPEKHLPQGGAAVGMSQVAGDTRPVDPFLSFVSLPCSNGLMNHGSAANTFPSSANWMPFATVMRSRARLVSAELALACFAASSARPHSFSARSRAAAACFPTSSASSRFSSAYPSARLERFRGRCSG